MELGARARRRIERNFDLAATTRAYEQVYREVIAAHESSASAAGIAPR
jgi:hypothetical protein